MKVMYFLRVLATICVFAATHLSLVAASETKIKTVAVAEVCTDDGFVMARRTNFDSLTAAGFASFLLPNVADTNLISALLDKADALIITGAIKASNIKKRNAFEFMVMRMAIEKGLPVVGFCRGQQMINRYFGGTIGPISTNLTPKIVHKGEISPYIQDAFHEMNIVPGTNLEKSFGTNKFTINTSHCYEIKKLGKGLKVTGKSPDGVIEAIEHETLPVTGFQFHPERLSKLNDAYVRIIRDAINHPACK